MSLSERPTALGRLNWVLGSIAIALFAACGGGGGGGSDGGSTPPPPAGNNTTNPPPAPTVSYGGSRASAVLAESNVGALADAVVSALQLAVTVGDESAEVVLEPDGTDRTITGANGGTARFVGKKNADSTGWTTIDYAQYRDGNTTFNGRRVGEVLETANAAVTRLSFHDFDVDSPSGHYNYAGSITLNRFYIVGSATTISGTLRVKDYDKDVELLVSGIVATRKPVDSGYELQATGRIFHSHYGWVDLSFSAPWHFRDLTRYPNHGGPLIGTAADGRSFALAALTREIVSLQYASTAPDLLDRSARLRWGDEFAVQTTRAPISQPVANAGPSRTVLPGTTLALAGAFSSHSETPFLRHRWRMLFRPPGSSATLDAPTAVNPPITLDVAGAYLLELVVDDGLRSSVDFVVLHAQTGVDTSTFPYTPAIFSSSGTAMLDATVTVETYRTPMALYDSDTSSYEVLSPRGDTVPSSQPGSFVASERGIYRLTLRNGSRQDDVRYVDVLTGNHFLPGVWLPLTANPLDPIVESADLDEDGRDDLIVSGQSAIEIFFGSDFPDMRATHVLGGTAGAKVAVGDLSGDGRADIATLTPSGIALFAQLPNGQFERRTIAASCGMLPRVPLAIVDLNGDGRNDLAIGCATKIDYFLADATGNLAAERSIPTASSASFELAAGDLNDDGIGDLLLAAEAGPNIGVVYGSTGTTPLVVHYLSLTTRHRGVPDVAIGDLNADGRHDFIYTGQAFSTLDADPDRVRVFHQTPTGQLVEAQVIDLPYPRRAVQGVFLGDLNADGAVDAGVHIPTNRFVMLPQITPGRFSEPTFAAFDCATQIAGDFNGDSHIDVACSYNRVGGPVLGLLLGRDAP